METENRTTDTKIVQTDAQAKDGQTKCPKCGATDISTNLNNGMLRCNYCRHEFAPAKLSGMVEDLTALEGRVVGSGAQSIVADAKDVVTFKCESCGAEVVVDTASAAQARCHWCRNTLSVNQQIENGAIPDAVLPFSFKRDEAKRLIEQFVGKRKFFAHPMFRKEFTTENVMGVYFPYMVVDANAHMLLSGQGEKLVRRYTRGSGEHQRTYYDADLYNVSRDYDVTIHGLTIESNSARRNNNGGQTNNIINSIMPFDVENCVHYDANYLKGFTSERRDTDIDALQKEVDSQMKDVAKFAANDSVKQYDRGVRWDTQNLTTKGQQWKTAYFPVWLYSYQQDKGNKKVLHYVAVNARTKETMGSVPIHMPKLIITSLIVELLGLVATVYLYDYFNYSWIFLSSGVVYYLFFYLKYRNADARHTYEKDTKTQVMNMKETDELNKRLTGLTNPTMQGANNTRVESQGVKNGALDMIANGINGSIVGDLLK